MLSKIYKTTTLITFACFCSPANMAAADEIKKVAPITSQFNLNGSLLTYGLKPDSGIQVGRSSGGSIDTTGVININLSQKIKEYYDERLYRRKQTSWYFQGKTFTKKDSLEINTSLPATIMGYRLKYSATGECLGESVSSKYCTYTPGLATRSDLFDENTGLPTGFVESTKTFSGISDSTYNALKSDGWQRGVNGSSETVGIDFDIPNSGSVESRNLAELGSVSRDSERKIGLAVSIARFDQEISSTSDSADLNRTIRAVAVAPSHDWDDLSIGMQIASWLLPSFKSKLTSASGDVRLDISNNIFHAAQNYWIPSNSLTMFHTGYGYVNHTDFIVKSAKDTPPAYYNGFWMGLTQTRSTETEYTSALGGFGIRRNVGSSAYMEGGVEANNQADLGNISIINENAGEITSVDLNSVPDLYVQSGLEMTNQSSVLKGSYKETNKYKFVPNFMYGGNRTDGTSVLRYYTGLMKISDGENYYLGADYKKILDNNIKYSLGFMHYTNPDSDHYSYINGEISKTTKLTEKTVVTFGANFMSSFDRIALSLDRYDALANSDNLDFFIYSNNLDGINYGLKYRMAREDDKEIEKSIILSAGYKVPGMFNMIAEITPYSEEDAYVRARAGFSWKISDKPDSGAFNLSLANISYDYSNISKYRAIKTSENALTASFGMKF